MKPRFEIRYSWIYNVLMNEHYWRYPLGKHEKLKKECKRFERLFNQNIRKIIKLVEKHSTGKWTYDFIPVYVVQYKQKLFKTGVSFADPLTLKYRKNEKRMLLVFIHELVHNYLDGKAQVKRGRKKNEELVWEITNKVWSDLNLGGIPPKEK